MHQAAQLVRAVVNGVARSGRRLDPLPDCRNGAGGEDVPPAPHPRIAAEGWKLLKLPP
jgi:hypothetical protein